MLSVIFFRRKSVEEPVTGEPDIERILIKFHPFQFFQFGIKKQEFAFYF